MIGLVNYKQWKSEKHRENGIKAEREVFAYMGGGGPYYIANILYNNSFISMKSSFDELNFEKQCHPNKGGIAGRRPVFYFGVIIALSAGWF